jgi:DNA-binding SARP family transcriptional activator/TolB-like protein
MTPVRTASLRLLGTVSLAGGDGSPLRGPPAQRHPLALLALLALAGERGVSREKLMAYLWPDRDAEHARQLLKRAVYILRKAIGDDALVTTRDSLRLDPASVRADTVEFEAALARGQEEAAIRLYGGPFLDGFFLDDAPEFERWAAHERDRLGAAFARALETLADAAEAARDFATAVERWKARAAHDPYDSRVALRLMRALEASGNRAGALRSAEFHRRLLQTEVGTEPAPEVLVWAERLRRAPAAAPWSAPPTAPPPAEAVVAAEPALLGPPLPPPAADPPTPPARRGRRARWGGWTAAATLVLALVAAGRWRLTRGTRPDVVAAPAGARARVLVADFTDRTRDSTYGDLVAHVVRSELARSRALSVVGPVTIEDALRRMRRPPDARLTAAVAREIAAREQIGAVIQGDVRPAGAGLVLTLSVVETATGT